MPAVTQNCVPNAVVKYTGFAKAAVGYFVLPNAAVLDAGLVNPAVSKTLLSHTLDSK